MADLDDKREYRKPLGRRVYDVAKIPARNVRNRYLYRLASRDFDEAVERSDYSWAELERIAEYIEYAFRRRTPEWPEPMQHPVRYLPGLRAQPIWDSGDFDFLDSLLQSREDVLDEFRAYRSHGTLSLHHQGLNDVGQWNVFYLHAAGTPNPEAVRHFPTSIHATEAIPGMGVVGQAYFSVLAPGTHVPPHCGPTNTKLRVQLRLDVPAGCEMRGQPGRSVFAHPGSAPWPHSERTDA